MVALVTSLRGAGATTIFTVEIPKITGPELDFSDTPLQSVAENLILLRHVELRGRFHRLVSILKMRASAHDFHLREFVIDERGLRVLEPFASAEGVLTGTARMSAEST
jgi:circadian clock protein KaiC